MIEYQYSVDYGGDTLSLKDFRYDKRMTMTEVAKQSGLTLSLYSQMENGKKNVTVRAAKLLEPVFGVKWYEIIEAASNESEDQNDGKLQ